jgi:tetratricopeptide (TPR) repeat protein
MKMTRKTILGILFLAAAALAVLPSLAAAQTPAPAGSTLIEESDALYAERADLAKAKEGLAKLEEALAAKEDAFSAYWRMARLSYWIGDHTPTNDAKKEIFSKGIDYAKKAIELGPDKPDGHFWLGVNYGVYGEARGKLKSLFLVKPIKEEMRRVLEIDPAYDHGGADRVLGRVFHEVPGIAGGSEKKSLEHLLKALEYGPHVGLNLLYIADTYLSLNRVEDARQALQTLVDMEPMPDLLPETAQEKGQAAERLSKKPFTKTK